MTTRLVVGCGRVGRAVIDAVGGSRDRLKVLDDDAERVEMLRGETVDADVVESITVDVLGKFAPVDTVLVASDDPTKNLEATQTAAAAIPDALLVAYTGENPSDETRDAIAALADRVVDPVSILAARVGDAIDPVEVKLQRLRRTIRGIDGTLGIVMHDNPDPDAIGAAVGLAELAEALDIPSKLFYYGEISHQENRALVNLLDLALVNLEPGEVPEVDGLALVDHSRPGVNDQLPPDSDVAIVIDHHPPRGPVKATYQDLRESVGATSTLVASYLESFDVEPSTKAATALRYGIQVDTKGFTRDVVETDFEAAAYLVPRTDESVLKRVESPSISGDTLEVIANAIKSRVVKDESLVTCVGQIRDRDALAQAADHLLALEDISVTLVCGIIGDTIFVSARSSEPGHDLGESLRDAFDQIGDAGGHADMAGAQIPLGSLGIVEADETETVEEIVCEVVTDRFFETIQAPPVTPGTRFGALLEAFGYGTDRDTL